MALLAFRVRRGGVGTASGPIVIAASFFPVVLAAVSLTMGFESGAGAWIAPSPAPAPPACLASGRALLPDPPRFLSGAALASAEESVLMHDGGTARRLLFRVGWSASDSPSAYGAADELFARGRYSEAFRAYHDEIFCDPDRAPSAWFRRSAQTRSEILFERALLSGSAGRYADARTALARAVAIDASFAEAWFFLGQLAVADGHSDLARSAWRSAIVLSSYARPPTPYPSGLAATDAMESLLHAAAGPLLHSSVDFDR